MNPSLNPAARDAVTALCEEIRDGAEIRPLPVQSLTRPDTQDWHDAFARRAGDTWHGTDWFFAETFTYRRLVEAVRYFETQLDPFLPIKRAEYATDAHREMFETALNIDAPADETLHRLIGMDLWGNRVDLSYAESRSHGTQTADEDVLVDDRAAIIARLQDKRGEVHVVADNAGTELTLDLVLIDALLRDSWVDRVVLHVKYHPTFVSDAIVDDVQSFILSCLRGKYGPHAQGFGMRLQAMAAAHRFQLQADPYWNSARYWWQMPERLLRQLQASALVLVKGDANYRRVVGDAYWPHETPFAQVVGDVGIPLACIRTLKSDPVVGLGPGVAERLQAADERWRWSGRRGLIQAYIS